MKEYISYSLEETAQIAHEWIKDISAEPKSDGALIVGLSGHLGAGKTAFVKLVAKELGVREEITSPTFVIMKMYPIEHPNWKRLVHIDAYRLEKSEELKAINFEKFAADPGNLIMVEWPENVELEKLFPRCRKIQFEIWDDKHHIKFSPSTI